MSLLAAGVAQVLALLAVLALAVVLVGSALAQVYPLPLAPITRSPWALVEMEEEELALAALLATIPYLARLLPQAVVLVD